MSGGSSTCATAHFQRERRRGGEEAGGEEGAATGCAKAGTASLSPLRGRDRRRRRGGVRPRRVICLRLPDPRPARREGRNSRRRRRSIVGLPQRADHLDLAGVRAGAALGAVHVLDQRRRMQRRCRARRRARCRRTGTASCRSAARSHAATKRSARNSTCAGLLDEVQPVERRHVAARKHMRVVDLEAGGQRIVEDEPRALASPSW